MKRCLACSTLVQDDWVCPRCGYAPKRIEGFLAFAPELATRYADNRTDFQTLARVEAGNFWFRARNRLIVWAIRRHFPCAKNVLEIGCGTGFVLSGIRSNFPTISLSGSEVSCAGLAFAAPRVPQASLFQMDARSIPFNEEFDVIGAFDVLEHIQEDDRVLTEIYHAAKPGGGIIVTVPQHAFLWSTVDETAGHVRRYSASELVNKIERAGFRVVMKTSFVSLLLPLMIASRLGQRKAGKVVATSEFMLNPIVNATFEKVLDIERGLVRLGVRFRAGGSLLAVARKQ